MSDTSTGLRKTAIAVRSIYHKHVCIELKMTTTFYEGFAVWLLLVGLVTASVLHYPLLVAVVSIPVTVIYIGHEFAKLDRAKASSEFDQKQLSH